MAKITVTLYVDDRSIRLMETAGKVVRAWASAPLEPGLIEGGVVKDEEKVVARIKWLLDDRGIASKRVILGMTGLRSLSMVAELPRLADNLLVEAVMRECSRVLPVPLEELYVSWMTLPSPKKRIRAFAAALPRDPTDSLLQAVRNAGLTPYLMDIKPLALARLATEANAMIVDVQSREYDIVILGKGIPQPIRTIPLTDEGLSWQEKLSMVRDDLLRTMEFYDSNNPENPIPPEMPVRVSGELADQPEACKSLSADLDRPVLPLLLPFQYPQEWSHNHFAVNAGLAIKAVSPGGKPASLVAKLDVLPPAYQPKSFSVSRVATLSGAAVAFSLIIPLVALIQMNSSDINELRARLETTTADMEQMKVERRELTKTLVQTETSRDAFAAALETLNMQQEGLNAALQVATALLPESVVLADINHDGSVLALQVDSFTEPEVLAYARSLESRVEFSEVAVAQMTRAECGKMRFILSLKVTD